MQDLAAVFLVGNVNSQKNWNYSCALNKLDLPYIQTLVDSDLNLKILKVMSHFAAVKWKTWGLDRYACLKQM